jgi:hypothetical protein
VRESESGGMTALPKMADGVLGMEARRTGGFQGASRMRSPAIAVDSFLFLFFRSMENGRVAGHENWPIPCQYSRGLRCSQPPIEGLTK